MKILHTVESYLPARHGMQEVVQRISEYLILNGHEVTVATSHDSNRCFSELNGVTIVDFKINGNSITGITGDVDLYTNYLLNSNFDIITNFAAQQWATDLMLPILSKIKGKKFIVPTGYSEFYNPAYKDYYKKMEKWLLDYNGSIYLSHDYIDINFARKIGAKNIIVIPNGADKLEFETTPYDNIKRRLKIPDDYKLILTVGNHTGFKGHSLCVDMLNTCKTKKIAMIIVGGKCQSGRRGKWLIKNVINVLGIKKSFCFFNCKISELIVNLFKKGKLLRVVVLSRELTVNAMRQADLFLFPSLIECSPIVLFECMAAKLPFIVSDVGNSKELISISGGGELIQTKKNKKGLSLANVKSGANLIDKNLLDSQLLQSIGNTGHNSFNQNFTWSIIAKKYQSVYES